MEEKKMNEGECLNCGHLLYFDPSTNQLQHFTRAFHDHGYPYSNQECYFGQRGKWCGCKEPQKNMRDHHHHWIDKHDNNVCLECGMIKENCWTQHKKRIELL
jgi:hypothetical protein